MSTKFGEEEEDEDDDEEEEEEKKKKGDQEENNIIVTRMWAHAQRGGRPAEHRWRPLFNAAKFGRRSLLACRAVTLPRRESR